MEAENSVNPNIIEELVSWKIQGYQMEGESSVTRSIMTNFIRWISKDIK